MRYDVCSLVIMGPQCRIACQPPDDDVSARCETVLNTTMAEFETYHRQKVEDFERFATEHLDGEIEFYEQVGKVYCENYSEYTHPD
jgi:WASP-binding domain of Sorting nexin protein